MSLLTLAAGETSIAKIVTMLRQLIRYVQGLAFSNLTGKADLTTQVTGILPIANGGTNVATASANKVFAGPTSGGATAPAFRSLVQADLPFDPAPITASLGSDVALNNTANYFDGPSVAQGSTGTWFVSGSVTIYDTAAAANFHVKLWDGTTVIDSGYFTSAGASFGCIAALSGFLAAPAGNLRMSVKDITSTNGKIIFNQTGNSKDSTITAFRIK